MIEKIEMIRKSIDEVDQEICDLLVKRLDLVGEIGRLKAKDNLPLTDEKRQEEILEKIKNLVGDNYPFLVPIYSTIFSVSKEKQKNVGSFVKGVACTSAIVDPVFAVARAAKADKDESCVNATIGALYDEEDKLVAFDSVYRIYDKVSDRDKASYAQSFVGNDDYLKAVEKWVLPNNLTKYRKVIATAGGTGAVGLAIKNTLDVGERVILPVIAWTSYQLMAEESGLKVENYDLFDTNQKFSLVSLKEKVLKISKLQRRIVLVVNDPAQNPTGYSMNLQEWQELIDFLNSLDNEVVLINDVAYLDYSYDLANAKEYISLFNNLSSRVLAVIAFSCSKTLTMYGMRLGAALMIGDKDAVDTMMTVFTRQSRALWSNINNAAMKTFANLVNGDLTNYYQEKQLYIDLLKKRADLFISEAASENLTCYPYSEGFFITVACKDNDYRDRFNEALIKDHIYLVVVDKGLRIAICGLSCDKLKGLAKRIKKAELSI